MLLLVALSLCASTVVTSCARTRDAANRPADNQATGPSGDATAAIKLSGLCFSPFVTDSPASGATITPELIDGLLTTVAPHTEGIRTFSSSGIGLETARLAKAKGLRVAAGCNIEGDEAADDAQVQALIDLCRSGYADLAVVGEEALYFKFVTEAKLIEYMRRVKTAGVKVTTSETWGELIGHPSVIRECDLLLANMFPYWEKVDITHAVEYLDRCYKKLEASARGKEIVVETGWPTEGETTGKAVASPTNARKFLEGFSDWAAANKVGYYYFEAFDEPWKATREGAVGAHWGIWQSDGQLKPSMEGLI